MLLSCLMFGMQHLSDAVATPTFEFCRSANIEKRDKALQLLQRLCPDDVYDILPQIVQAVKFDWPGYFGTIQFLLHQAAISPRIAHMLFWYELLRIFYHIIAIMCVHSITCVCCIIYVANVSSGGGLLWVANCFRGTEII